MLAGFAASSKAWRARRPGALILGTRSRARSPTFAVHGCRAQLVPLNDLHRARARLILEDAAPTVVLHVPANDIVAPLLAALGINAAIALGRRAAARCLARPGHRAAALPHRTISHPA